MRCHLAAALVKPGQNVVQGQAVGLEGSTGNSTGPHVHFELLLNGQPVSKPGPDRAQVFQAPYLLP